MDFLADTSYKQSQAEVIGSLTASAVATGSQLVGYSGFSNEAFIREPASTDLDFGTGEWSASAWVNIPATLTTSSFQTVGTDLIANGNFDTDATGWTYTGWIYSSGLMSSPDPLSSISVNASLSQTFTTIPGKTYKVSFTIGSHQTIGGGYVRVTIPGSTIDLAIGTYTYYFVATTTSHSIIFQTYSGGSLWRGTIDSISILEMEPARILDRSYNSGQKFLIGLNVTGTLTSHIYDGTTWRIVSSSSSYNTGTWLKVDTYYKTDGSLSIAINGQQVATTGSQTPLLTLNNSNAVLTIGNNYSLTAPFPGSIALLKLSATVPTTEQLQWMYEQEKALFNQNTLCALPDSNSVLDLTYEDDTNRLIAISQSNESYWTGLTRVVTEPVTTGGLLSKVAAASNVHLIARSTVDAGVDVTIPASNIKTMLERDRAAETIQQITIFDYDPAVFSSASLSSTTPSIMTCVAANVTNTPYVGMTITGTGITAGTTIVGIVTGTPNTYYLSNPFTGTTGTYTVSQTSFQLPIGYTTTAVYKNGTELRESISATKDWTRSFDGFKEVIILTTAPASNEWIQIHATKDN